MLVRILITATCLALLPVSTAGAMFSAGHTLLRPHASAAHSKCASAARLHAVRARQHGGHACRATTRGKPKNLTRPTIAGNPTVGQRLFAAVGRWSGAAPLSFTYQWQYTNGSDIPGATFSTYTLGPSSAGRQIEVIVTGRNRAGKRSVQSMPTATVSSRPEPPSAISPPVISGSAIQGKVLSASQGTWSGSPSSFAYQWQLCNSGGGACGNVPGATAASRTLTAQDIGHTVRVVVVAGNSVGRSSAVSNPSAIVVAEKPKEEEKPKEKPKEEKPKEEEKEKEKEKPKEEEHRSCTQTLNTGSNIQSILRGVVSGAVECLSSGNYGQLVLEGINPSSYVTIAPAPGAHVTLNGVLVGNSSHLRFEHLTLTEGFNLRDLEGAVSHDYQLVGNTIEGARYGVVVFGHKGPITHVLIEGNTMRNIDFPGSSCSPGYAGGQGVTIEWGDGITVSHNVFQSVSEHYVQGGAGGSLGMVVEHNLFEGPIPASKRNCTHLNVWQIFSGSAHDKFSSNIVRGEPGNPAAINALLFETGPSGENCSQSYSDIAVEDNLFVNGSSAYDLQLYEANGMTVAKNTIVKAGYGAWIGRPGGGHCHTARNYTVNHNIVVQNELSNVNLEMDECAGTCLFNENVTSDSSANANGSSRQMTGWSPKWKTTSWNPESQPHAPSGYYVPEGLPFEAGYGGSVGP